MSSKSLTFRLKPSVTRSDAVSDLNLENSFPTLSCADKYDFPLLVDLCCCCYILEHLHPDNCLVALENANAWCPDFDNIVEKCLHLIDASDGAVFLLEHFFALSHRTLQMIVQRDTLAAPENIIYTAVEAWAAETCRRQNMDPSSANRREVLGNVLFRVRFPLLTDAEMASGPLKQPDVALGQPDVASEFWDICMYKNTTDKPVMLFDSAPRRSVLFSVGGTMFKY
ncbi:BTB/POZ domain-containing protein 1-like, partial [Paramacrobiotus metropolitanus]|uniref:BTB/POZ domain-containing protein 1-like n=1 Tax=Paramacrobiotus metropolitanus TaxID=2943436 RepID=UPI0024456515